MLRSGKIKKAIYRLIWLILPCLISSSLYAFYYRISYTNTSGERVSFYIKTHAFMGGREVHLNRGWLQQHSTFLSFGSFTVVGLPRYTIEPVEAVDTLGHFVFNILGGPEVSTLDLHNPDEPAGTDCEPNNNAVYRVDPGVELARTVLPALQLIEGELARSSIQEISGLSGVNYVNEGNQFDLYVHFITSLSAPDASIMDNACSLADSLSAEGVISGWRHQSRSIRRPVENMLTLVFSGLFDPDSSGRESEISQQECSTQSSQRYSGSNSYRRDRLQILLTRFLEAGWNGCNTLVFQVGYSQGVYITLNDSGHENERMSYDARAVLLFSNQIISRRVDSISEDVESNRATRGAQRPTYEYSGYLSGEYWQIIEILLSHNLATVYRNSTFDRQNCTTPRYFLISSVLFPPNRGPYWIRKMGRDFEMLRTGIAASDLFLELRFINIEDERDEARTRVNFMLVSYINDIDQERDTLQLVQNINLSTNFMTWAREWHPVSISVQRQDSALAFVPAQRLSLVPAGEVVWGDIPLETLGNGHREPNEEGCDCPPGSENRSASE